MALKPYKTFMQSSQDEFIVNKSRFIGYGCPVETEEEALKFLNEILFTLCIISFTDICTYTCT